MHPGERIHHPVAFITDDFRAYHDLAPYFAEQQVQLLGLRPDEAVPESVQAIICGPPNDARTVPLLSPAATLLACLDKMDPRGPAKQCIFGVDPGETIGLAVVCDGAPRLIGTAHTPNEAEAILLDWSRGITCPIRVHVGDGNGPKPDLDQWPTFLVPEHRTSPPGPVTGSRHTDAAILIALRKPLS